MKKKKWLKLVTLSVMTLLIIDVGASLFFYNLAIKREETKDFLQGNKDLEVSAEAMAEFTRGDWRDWVNEQAFETMTLESFDGLDLRGYFSRADEPTDKVVILSHGYLGHGKQMGLYGKYYYETLGYHIFMADARGHGDSEGDYYGFGWHDRLDLIAWTNQLVERLGPNTEVVWHGLSMGAATVLMASGEDVPDQVKAIVADSPYESVYDLFAYQMKRMFHLPAFPILDSTSFVAKARAGYTFKEASALEQVEKADVPILYIAGNADTFVPTDMAQNLYNHTKSEADILTVDGANHGESFIIDRDAYLERLNGFLAQYVQ
ncbi:alpha/beta hydrolase [Lentibacillus saliphilus]|uniref:alpha/beta hydrolase n=1 Tax=Lentibacillus saliphilus TaxID=2737028 RepID=UPI001C2F6CDF|nr:alpha/beta hydrolase [Lentibacillus saliphilus]